jgi:uncharacterized damage-inducible protein DinB
MNKEDVELLMGYDRWANGRVLAAADALTGEQFTRDLGGSFRSVRDVLAHIVGGEWGWLTFWKEATPGPAFLKDLWERHDALFRPEKFADVAALQGKLAEIEKEQMEFVSGLTKESLGRLLPLRVTRVKLALLMQHAVNHATYHRGQVSLMMRQVGGKPVATDLHLFLLEGGQ